MNTSNGLKQRLLRNRIKFNNMMMNIKKRKNIKNDIKTFKINLLNANQSLQENYLLQNEFNIINKTMGKNSNHLNNILSQIKRPDARLIYCIKKLGLSRYYSNFSQNNLTFEEFLTLTNEDMTKMKIPKNFQKIVHQFIFEYFKYRELFTFEELQNFFRSKKSPNNLSNQKMSQSFDICKKGVNVKNNNCMNPKNILYNNYIHENNIKENNYNISRNKAKLNQKKLYKSSTPSKKNFFY